MSFKSLNRKYYLSFAKYYNIDYFLYFYYNIYYYFEKKILIKKNQRKLFNFSYLRFYNIIKNIFKVIK